MTISVDPLSPADRRPAAAKLAPRVFRWHGVALFVTLSIAYFAIGAVLMMRYNVFEPDGISRVANAGFTLLSRKPHLSAVGFVWNPLPSLVEIPIMPFSRWWPELKTHGLAGALQSALFMAGGAVMVRRIALDRGTGTVWRWVAVGCFALNPVIVVYGGSGMSEAAEIFCLLWCVRHLLRWVKAHAVGDLAWAGVALGVGYLVRYEMVPAACGVAVLVAAVAFHYCPRSTRRDTAMLATVIVCFPIMTAVVFWAVSGWILNGELFATLSSQYGNTSLVTEARAAGTAHDGAWWVIARRVLAMQPFIGIAAILAAALSLLTRSVEAMVPVATFGAVLAFSAWAEHNGTTFGFFRYYITAIPMVIVVALVCWAPTDRPVAAWRFGSLAAKLGAGLLCLSLLVATPVTTRSMLDGEIGNHQVQFGLASLIDPQRNAPGELWYRRVSDDDRLIAAYLDRRHLPEGSVLIDSFVGWAVWLASDQPKQFVITSDYDFVTALNRPWAFGISYIVVTNPAGSAAPDALNKRYPSLWTDGGGLGTLILSATGAFGEEKWRIYRVDPPPEPAG